MMDCTTVCGDFVFVVIASLVLLAPGAFGASVSDGNDGNHPLGSLEVGLIVGGVACVVAMVILIALCADRRVHIDKLDRGPPYWTKSLVFKQEYNGGLSAVSEGMNNLSPFHVVRERLGRAVTDGARWDVGFNEGKHVFEVVWLAKKNRGTNSSLGMATKEVPLQKPGRITLVGHHSQSWGFDLSSRKMVHTNQRTGSFPEQIPDRFYLYVDMDSGKVGIGQDVKQFGRQALFYGYIINNIKVGSNVPMHLMIGMCAPKEEVQVYYIGTAIPQGGFDLIPPDPQAPPQAAIYGQPPVEQQQQQPPAQQQQQPSENQGPPPQAAVY